MSQSTPHGNEFLGADARILSIEGHRIDSMNTFYEITQNALVPSFYKGS